MLDKVWPSMILEFRYSLLVVFRPFWLKARDPSTEN